jgi:hypothetical protein
MKYKHLKTYEKILLKQLKYNHPNTHEIGSFLDEFAIY